MDDGISINRLIVESTSSLSRNAGAFMATLVVLPLTTNASDDEPYRPVALPAATYTLAGSDNTVAIFTLVENDGSMVLTLVEETVVRDFDDDDDD